MSVFVHYWGRDGHKTGFNSNNHTILASAASGSHQAVKCLTSMTRGQEAYSREPNSRFPYKASRLAVIKGHSRTDSLLRTWTCSAGKSRAIDDESQLIASWPTGVWVDDDIWFSLAIEMPRDGSSHCMSVVCFLDISP